MRKQIAAANWKMNLTADQGASLINDIITAKPEFGVNQMALLGIPFPYLQQSVKALNASEKIKVAAQNCSDKKSGAYTGEVSADMLQSIDVQYCIIGHSERREYFFETGKMLADKINICLSTGITPVFCCGEPLRIREEEHQNTYVGQQLDESLFHLSTDDMAKIIIAYEPIWAIGTGRTATSEQAQEMHRHIRSVIRSKFGERVAGEVSILYGGSVKGSNAGEIFASPDVDGGLVGGASLNAKEFVDIIKALKK